MIILGFVKLTLGFSSIHVLSVVPMAACVFARDFVSVALSVLCRWVSRPSYVGKGTDSLWHVGSLSEVWPRCLAFSLVFRARLACALLCLNFSIASVCLDGSSATWFGPWAAGGDKGGHQASLLDLFADKLSGDD